MKTQKGLTVDVVVCNCGVAMTWRKWYEPRRAEVLTVWRCPNCGQVVLETEKDKDVFSRKKEKQNETFTE